MSAECRDIEALLSPYADGELDDTEVQRVEAHLATCPSCRARLEAWRESEAALASIQPARSDVEWERLAQRVEDAIGEEERAATRVAAAPPPHGRLRPWIWGGSGILAAAALVGLFWPWVVEGPTFHRKAETPSAGQREEVQSGAAGEARDEAPPTSATGVPIADGDEARLQGVDVRRVAIAQEQKEKGMLSAKLQSAEGTAAESEAPAPREEPSPVGASNTEGALRDVARMAAPLALSAVSGTLKATDEAVRFEESEPEGGARTLAELQDRFARLAEESVRARARAQAGSFQDRAFSTPGAGTPPVPGGAEKSEADAAAPGASPATVLAWAEKRRAEGDALRAREAYTLLTRDFPGNDTRAGAWFGRADLAATEALRGRTKDAMERAAAELEGALREFPADPHRTDALAQRARLWAALAAQDPSRCAKATVARAEWQAAAGAGVAFPDPAPEDADCR